MMKEGLVASITVLVSDNMGAYYPRGSPVYRVVAQALMLSIITLVLTLCQWRARP